MPPASLDTVLFDLDGTLIDSIELIQKSYVHAIDAHGLPQPDESFWLAGLGRPLVWQFAQFTDDPAEVEALIQGLRSHGHHRLLTRNQLEIGDWQLDQPLVAPTAQRLGSDGARQAALALIRLAEQLADQRHIAKDGILFNSFNGQTGNRLTGETVF